MTDRKSLIDRGTSLLLLRSGGHFEAIRDMSAEKARADAEVVLAPALDEIDRLRAALGGLLEAIGWPQDTDEDCGFVDERVDAARALLPPVSAARDEGGA